MPSATRFPELNLRTYVRSIETRQPGVYFFSLDAASALAVAGARMLFSLPYFWAQMHSTRDEDGWIHYRSRRLLTKPSANFRVRYRSLGRPGIGPLEDFLTARYCLYTRRGGELTVGNIHHLPWPLELAEAEFEVNDLPMASGIAVLTWGGLRGGISIALALSLEESPYRGALLAVCYGVVVFTILVQGLSMPLLIRRLYKRSTV